MAEQAAHGCGTSGCLKCGGYVYAHWDGCPDKPAAIDCKRDTGMVTDFLTAEDEVYQLEEQLHGWGPGRNESIWRVVERGILADLKRSAERMTKHAYDGNMGVKGMRFRIRRFAAVEVVPDVQHVVEIKAVDMRGSEAEQLLSKMGGFGLTDPNDDDADAAP